MGFPHLGDVPGWIGASSIVLAFTIFWQDRRNRSRALVDAVGVWTEVAYSPRDPFATEPVGVVHARVNVNNSANVPVKIVQVGCELRTTWLVEELTADGEPQALRNWAPVPGNEPPVRFFLGPITIAPGEKWSQDQSSNVDHMRPERASQLDIRGGADCRVAYALIIDNAGRRWRIRPGEKGRAKAIRRSTKRQEYEPVEW